ncbi:MULTISPECIES: IS66 family transposase [Roseobacteraceae]|uniref:IS66 family transposase n=1 Tax=Marivita cryptomonadis TaxID=505252 RepID=A0A9Q2P1I6_9RHOB|nr:MULTISPECIES: IS66 family transposase [Roseobacteraceae]MBM2082097.1 IS66 family transposase [Pseudosulfitobacter pseudonitzschiae]MBM2323954.1 IS66 family transposase [Marivita cryptomonadis]MBM2333543.1 IS66 family transposase [Marivita cryptomonadis]MBM2343121.1 IS66 family transposase [Marivita cryptomonadis]MBM2347792.1 IS66 family transposase [Marivita cryptomonadis]
MSFPADLPTDVATLQALLRAAEERASERDARLAERDAVIERKEERIVRLEKLVADFKRAMFGSKSEKADPDQYQLALEDIETAIATVHAEDEAIDPPKAQPRKRDANRGALPKHLPRVEEIITPESTTCDCGCDRHVIGEDTSERLDIIPAQFRVIVTRRPKYACRSCESGIVQAPAVSRLIESGLPTEATVASVIVAKFADHLPLYRQAQIYARQGVDLDRSTLAAWVGKAAYELAPVYDALIADLKRSTKLFMDETTAPVLDPGKGKVKKGYFWALARDDRPWNGDDPPGVAFTYAPGRSGKHAVDILKGFDGILQVDGYTGYNRVIDPKRQANIRLAYCWAHARRKLFELTKNSAAPIAQEGLRQITSLYRVEAQIRSLPASQRLAVRQDKSAPMVADFKTWLEQARAQVSAKSPTGEALKYIAKYWDGLILFLTDGRIEMDNNTVERTIRPIAIGRKNSLFAGHEAGAQNWAVLASLCETCKLNGMEPHGYLTQTLTAIVNGHRQSQINELLPWNYVQTV